MSFLASFGLFILQAGMVEFIGILKVKVIRGTKLAVRDLISSDPYVVLILGQQVLHSTSLSNPRQIDS
jgi:stromal membrane-associated protein